MNSSHRPSAPSLRSTFVALSMAAALADGAPAETFRGRGADGDLLLVRAGDEHVVELAGGGRVVLPLSRRAIASDFRTDGASWWVAAVDRDADGPSLAVIQGRGADFEALPEPAAGPARIVRDPRLLTGAGELHGVAWLEGDAVSRLRVRAARWRGGSWTEPVTISPPGPGTQIGLTIARLADGSWLAAWSAFDGNDDEILWSRLAGGSWSAPRPAAENNQVPDITPRLTRSGDGALLAWTRYDGNDYRVHTARFDGGEWSRPAVVGPEGSVDPAFSDSGFEASENPLLVFRRAVPNGWQVAELDAAGKVLRTTAGVTSASDEPPAVAAVDAGGVILDWAGKSATLSWSR